MARRRKRKDIEEEIEQLEREIEEEMKRIDEEIEQKYAVAAKKIDDYIERWLASAGINKILILDFVLPSADLKSKTIKIEDKGKVLTRKRGLSDADLKAIPALRSRFYQILHEHGAFKIGNKTWAILPGYERGLIKPANEKLKEMNRIIVKYGFPPRRLSFIEAYAPTSWVEEKIAETIIKFRQDLMKTLEKLKEKEKEKKKRRELASRASKLRKIIARLEDELRELQRLEEERAKRYINDVLAGRLQAVPEEDVQRLRELQRLEEERAKRYVGGKRLNEKLGSLEGEEAELELEEPEKRGRRYLNI